MTDKTFIAYLFVAITTVCQSQLPYPIQPRFVVPVGYVETPENSEFYPRRQYLTFYGQSPEEEVPDEYTYEDYYSEAEDDVDPIYSHKESPSDLLMKYVLGNQRRNEQIELSRRNQIEKSSAVASEPRLKGQKEFAMYRSPADGRRVRPAWYPSLEDQLSRVKGRDQQELTTKKPESRVKKDELTVQLDKLKEPPKV